MAIRPTIDLDLLRTFSLIAKERNFTRVSERIGRTQSAVSLQVQRLEGQVGQPLFSRRRGGDVELTQAGERLLMRARELLALNDEIIGSLHSGEIITSIRLGFPETFSQLFVPAILEEFTKKRPGAVIELLHAPSCQLVSMLDEDDLDLMVCIGGHEAPGPERDVLWRAPLRWVSSRDHDVHLQNPLPLTMGPKDCPFRPAWLGECLWSGFAITALERAGREFSVVSRSSTVEAQQLAAMSGTSVIVSVDLLVDARLRTLGEAEGLPELPETKLLLIRNHKSAKPESEALAQTISDVFRQFRSD